MKALLFTWPAQIAIAFFLDLLIGDPENFFHPIRWIGRVIEKSEGPLRKIFGNPTAAGIVLAIGCPALVAGAVLLILAGADGIHGWLGFCVRVYIFYVCLSIKDLSRQVRRVLASLEQGDIVKARVWLGHIVGRNTQHLDQKEILRAAVETTAESTVDGVVSVLFYAFLLGPAGAMVFKTVSTLDSMVGYKNERYEKFGWASAKLDDLLNFIPAILTAFFTGLAAAALGKSAPDVWRCVLRDARKQPGSNSDYPEAAFAGALNVRLGGENFYQGKSVVKPPLGDGKEELSIHKARESLRLMLWISLITLVSGIGISRFAAFVCKSTQS